MAYPDGFTHVRGPGDIQWFDVASTATFLARNPVAFSDANRDLVEADSGTTAIVGIAQASAADSIGGTLGGKVPVLVPTAKDVFATKVQTGVAAASLEVGETFNIEKSGNYLRLDSDSKTSAVLVAVPRGYTNLAYDSVDSSMYVSFLGNNIGPMGSNQSRRYD